MVMKVKELLAECQKIIYEGYGECNVWISRDEEGNGFHPLLYSFTTSPAEVEGLLDYTGEICNNADNVVILG